MGWGGNESKIGNRGHSLWREFSMCKVSALVSPPCAHKSPQKFLEKGVCYLKGTSKHEGTEHATGNLCFLFYFHTLERIFNEDT